MNNFNLSSFSTTDLNRVPPMNTLSPISNGSSQRLHPLSLFVQFTSRQASGHLHVTSQVSSGPASWFIFLEAGKLTFASNSVNPFERLDRHLNQLSEKVPMLVSGIRQQVRQLFEPTQEIVTDVPADYQAIQWLVEQQYLNPAYAKMLIAELAKEVIESLLRVTEGNYKFIQKDDIVGFPSICQLELRPLVEACQMQLRRQIANRTLFNPNQPPVAPPVPETADNRLEPADSANPEVPPAQSSNQSSKLKGHYTIACIDDSPTVLQAIHSFLDDANCSIVMINDPLKALMQVVRCKPDLVLLDVGMPSLDGYELCSLLRRHSNFKHTPIVMVTGHTGFIDRAKAKLVGASGYLTKPFTRPELLKMVFKFLT
jgi:twitching motility two-component system response regulator PilG